MNSFDCGDTRATVLILDGTRVNDVHIYDDGITPCVKSRMGTGGNNVPFIAQETDMTDVNGSDIAATLRGFGHGWQGQHNSTNAVVQETEMPFAIDGYNQTISDDIYHTIDARTYKGDDLIAQETDMTDPTLSFDTQFGSNANVFKNVSPTVKASQQSPSVAYDEYNDQLGGEVHHALRAGTRQSTGVLIDATGFKPGASADARTIGYEEGLAPSLEAGGGGNNRPAVLTPTMVVRRLSPIECERLMGWPDDHTLPRADGKPNSDTTRYKMCGNGVASPVAQWIGEQLMKVAND